jgi:uncharacterized protein
MVRMPPLQVPALGRFAWLMGLYADNYRRLLGLFDLRELQPGRYASAGEDGLALWLDVLERSAHTLELRLSYAMTDPQTGLPDPSAVLRVYLDSAQAEASHCYIGRRWQDVLGLHPVPQVLMGHRLRMNAFLSKWLEFLAVQGHGRHTLQRQMAEPLPRADSVIANNA